MTDKRKNDKIDSIKKQIISLIKEKGFPVGYIAECGDSHTGYFAKNPDDIIPLGYASDGTEEPMKLEDLTLIELSTLLDGVRKKDKDWKSLLSTVEQERIDCGKNKEIDIE